MRITSAIKNEDEDEYLVSIRDEQKGKRDMEVLFSNKPMDYNSLFDKKKYDSDMEMEVPKRVKGRFQFAEVTNCYKYKDTMYVFLVFEKLNDTVFDGWIKEYGDEDSHIEFF